MEVATEGGCSSTGRTTESVWQQHRAGEGHGGNKAGAWQRHMKGLAAKSEDQGSETRTTGCLRRQHREGKGAIEERCGSKPQGIWGKRGRI